MAADLNSCNFIGRLGRDVDVKELKNGDKMSTFSIAVGESYINKQGEKVKKTEWINIVAYRKLGEICAQYLTKGSQVYVSGKLNTNKYQGKDGSEKISTQIILEQMQMLGTKYHQDASTAPKEEASGKQTLDDFDQDDIPF